MSVNNLASGHVVPPEMAKVVGPGPQPVVGPPPTQFRGQGIGQVEVSFQLSREKAKKFKDIAERDHSLITQLQRFGIHSIRFQGLPSAHRPEHRVRSPYPYPHRAVPMPNQRFLYQPGNHPMQAQPNHAQNQMETDAKGTKRKKRPNVQNKMQNMPPTAQNPPVHPKAISPLVSPGSHGLYAHGNPPNFHQQGAHRVQMRPPRPPMIIQRAPQIQHLRHVHTDAAGNIIPVINSNMIPPGHPIPMQVQTPHGNPPQVSQVPNQNVALHQNVTMQMQNVPNQQMQQQMQIQHQQLQIQHQQQQQQQIQANQLQGQQQGPGQQQQIQQPQSPQLQPQSPQLQQQVVSPQSVGQMQQTPVMQQQQQIQQQQILQQQQKQVVGSDQSTTSGQQKMETGDETDELHEIISGGASQPTAYSIGNEDAKKSEILKFLLDPADSNFSFETALNPSSSSSNNSISNNSMSQSSNSTTTTITPSTNPSQPTQKQSQADQQLHQQHHQQQQQQQQQQATNQGQSNPVFKVPRPPKKKV